MKLSAMSSPGSRFSRWGVIVAVLLAALAVSGGLRLVMLGLSGEGESHPQPLSGVDDSGDAAATSDGGFPCVIDSLHGPVRIESRPERIVSQTVFTDEVLLEICDPQRIAGLHALVLDPRYSLSVAAAQPLADRAMNGVEPVILAQPDLIFLASFSRAEVVHQLRQTTSAPVLRLSGFDSLGGIRQNIRAVGRAVGEPAKAQRLIERMNQRIAAVSERVPQHDRLGVLSYAVSGYTAGRQTTFHDAVRLAGAENLAATRGGIEGHAQISREQLVVWNPDAIVVGADPGQAEARRAKLLSDPVIARTEAGQSGRIIAIPHRVLTTTSHHFALLVERLAAALHPERFPSAAEDGSGPDRTGEGSNDG